jgi:hypothetical protein
LAAGTPEIFGMGARNRNHRPNREDPPRKMPAYAPPGPVPTLGELSAQNVRELRVWCGAWPQRCFHRGVLSFATLDLSQTIEDVSRRLVCTKCGLIGGHAQPTWP